MNGVHCIHHIRAGKYAGRMILIGASGIEETHRVQNEGVSC
jgi:hypothetical protein